MEKVPEAKVFQAYLTQRYNCCADYLETESTNCGNNITYLLELLKKEAIPFQNIILCQDATMQRRMNAGIRKHISGKIRVINYASYQAEVIADAETLKYKEKIHGMWEMECYISLLMGEIPRLKDDENGYGPNGKGYIAHVEIPKEVEKAFLYLKTIYKDIKLEKQIRFAHPLSKKIHVYRKCFA